jgi:hypothetical protein
LIASIAILSLFSCVDREDEKLEQMLRTDFDFFEDYFSDKFEELNKLKKEVKNLYESYGWEMEK